MTVHSQEFCFKKAYAWLSQKVQTKAVRRVQVVEPIYF